MKNTILGLIIGVCVTVTGFHVWFVYNINKQFVSVINQVSKNSSDIIQIANFLQGQTKTTSSTTQESINK